MSENTSPHDSFCKEIMARPEVATGFLAKGMPGLLKRLPWLEYYLCELSKYTAGEIRGNPILRAGLLVMKYIRSNDLGSRLSAIFGLLTIYRLQTD